jgi:adenylate cyclase
MSMPALAPDFNPIRVRSVHDGRGVPIIERDLTRWLLAEGRVIDGDAFLFDELCWRLVGAGVKLSRATLHIGTLHPQFIGFGVRWRREPNRVERIKVHHGVLETEDFRTSPIKRVISEGMMERFRKTDEAWERLPLLRQLRAEGVTDYLATPLALRRRHQAATWATDAPGGFTDVQTEIICSVIPALATVMEVRALAKMSELLLETYLGHFVGPRILAGQIHRGVGERMRAVILSSDLRGFTRLSDTLPGEEVIELLDDYFECIAEPVHTHGGDVLKFVGDGLLAIFPCIDGDTPDAAAAAMEAARAGLERLAKWNGEAAATHRSVVHAGIGLHLGDVIYGNVGAPDRLDFTAIGPAVNLATRLEGLTKRLDRPLLCSHDFARAYRGKLVSLGFQPVRGLATPEEIFAPE